MSQPHDTPAPGQEPATTAAVRDGEAVAARPPQDPAERQEMIQTLVTQTRETHYGEGLEEVTVALNSAIHEAGLPEQPHAWVEATAAEISERRHVVSDRQLAVSSGAGADEVPEEAHDSDA